MGTFMFLWRLFSFWRIPMPLGQQPHSPLMVSVLTYAHAIGIALAFDWVVKILGLWWLHGILKFSGLKSESESLSVNSFYSLSWPLILGFIVCTGLLFFTTWQTSVDPDAYMHLVIGRWMLEHWSIPRVDIYLTH